MIHYITGDIFQSDAVALVNTINTEGIIGKGIASQFKKRYPNNFKAYEKACQKGEVYMGRMFTYTENFEYDKRIIVNFPTKKLWKDKSKLDEIVLGLQDLADTVTSLGITSIAIPPLGCGLGGLRWVDVKKEIEKVFEPLPEVTVYIYEPLKKKTYTSAHEPSKEMNELKSAALLVFIEYMKHSKATDISSIETHNLMYFTQNFGIEFNFKFAPFSYGIYCNNLDEVFNEIGNVWIQRFKKNSTNSFETFRIPAGVKTDNLEVTDAHKASIQKMFAFLNGYENPLGMELLATMYWLIVREHVERTVPAIQQGIENWCSKNNQNWGERKLYYFTPDLLEKALERINNFLPESA